MENSIFLGMQQEPLTWLEKAVKTPRQVLNARFGNMLGEHLVYIKQTRIPKILLEDMKVNFGVEAEPYPFIYDIEILVNPDPEGLAYAGIGMQFTSLSYVEITQFLSQIRDEVNTVFAEHRSNQDKK